MSSSGMRCEGLLVGSFPAHGTPHVQTRVWLECSHAHFEGIPHHWVNIARMVFAVFKATFA